MTLTDYLYLLRLLKSNYVIYKRKTKKNETKVEEEVHNFVYSICTMIWCTNHVQFEWLRVLAAPAHGNMIIVQNIRRLLRNIAKETINFDFVGGSLRYKMKNGFYLFVSLSKLENSFNDLSTWKEDHPKMSIF